eukprot:TRINITY_DN655_c1_g2_i4.p1 TRINITY_DN655_c1_g2~~TRINITY_DN655_c1_g2_i4.p1  ORF type:complete len:636 (-),score=141.18 TRINITY_DN655_c1_g2_i4:169-2076(-)
MDMIRQTKCLFVCKDVLMSNSIRCGSVLLFAAVAFNGLLLRGAVGQDDPVAQPDHPLVVAAVASVDRLLDNAVDVMQANGNATTREDVIALLKASVIDVGEENASQWFDLTKPAGVMYFFDSAWLMPGAAEASKVEGEGEASPGAPSTVEAAVSATGLSPKRFVAFFPVKDYQQMLEQGKWTPVDGKVNCFRNDKGGEEYARRFGNYVVIGEDGDTVDHCPDPREIAKSVLGKNNVAISLQLKGLPPLFRSLGAEGIKSVYDAGLQRRDDEQERDYRLRRALGDISRELLDLAMTQVDEVTLGFRIQEGVRSIFDLEINGGAEGMLAKFATEMTPKKSAFDPLWNSDYDQSLGISLALPQRHAKPLAAAIRNYVLTASEADEVATLKLNAPMIDAGCRMLETNQFELICSGERDGDANVSLYGLRVPTNRDFPQQFEGLIRAIPQSEGQEMSTTSLEGIPVYHLKNVPFLPYALHTTVSQMTSNHVELAETKSNSWVAATPDALWFCSRAGESDESIPTLLHRAINVKSLAADGAKNRPSVAPFRMSLHPRHWMGMSIDSEESDATIDRKPDPARDENLAQQEKRQQLYDAHPDGISVELLPTARGLKLTMAFDAVYAVLVPRMINETFLGLGTP